MLRVLKDNESNENIHSSKLYRCEDRLCYIFIFILSIIARVCTYKQLLSQYQVVYVLDLVVIYVSIICRCCRIE